MKKTRQSIYAAAPIIAMGIIAGIWHLLPLHVKANPAQGLDPPKFEVDRFWPKPLPKQWVTGDLSGTCIDAQDHVFIVNRSVLTTKEQQVAELAPPIIEFDTEGRVVNSWGDLDTLPKSLHSCTIDDQDNVWLAGGQDGIVQKYSHDGSKLLLQIGTRGQLDTSDGTVTGAPMNSSHTMLNRPASIAIDPTNGDVYVGDGYGNRRVVVFDREGHFLRQWGQQGTAAQVEAGIGGVFLEHVHCVAIDNAGLVYVCDRKGDRIEVFDKMGNFQKNIYIKKGTGKLTSIGSTWWIAFSRDRSQKYMYVADGGNEVIWTLDHATGQILSSFGRSGHQTGEFTYLHTISVDSKGNLIAGETIGGRRVQRFKRTGNEP
jgi:DNA-binding beta-propeller fold protein YncE